MIDRSNTMQLIAMSSFIYFKIWLDVHSSGPRLRFFHLDLRLLSENYQIIDAKFAICMAFWGSSIRILRDEW